MEPGGTHQRTRHPAARARAIAGAAASGGTVALVVAFATLAPPPDAPVTAEVVGAAAPARSPSPTSGVTAPTTTTLAGRGATSASRATTTTTVAPATPSTTAKAASSPRAVTRSRAS